MAAESVLVVRADGTAGLIAWPAGDDDRRAVLVAALGARTTMRRCGKGILGFSADASADDAAQDDAALDDAAASPVNTFAMAAFAEQGVELHGELRGPVLFARNPSKGSVVKPLTAAQSANLLVVTGARLD